MEVTMVFVSTSDRVLLTLVLSHTSDPLQLIPDAALLFLVDFLVHKSKGNVSYTLKQVDYNSSEVPYEARLCLLPCCVDEDHVTCVAGLAGCARHLIQCGTPELSSLLGFRNICLKSPSEFSTWTKFCEITFPLAIKQLLHSITSGQVELPLELLQLEKTLRDQPLVHNRQKIIKETAKVTNTVDRYVEGYSMLLSDLLIFATFHHALMLIADEQFCIHLPAAMGWYRLMSQNPSISYAMSQWNKNLVGSVPSQIKPEALTVPVDNRVSSIKDSTPKKLRRITHHNCFSSMESVLDKVKNMQLTVQNSSKEPPSMLWDKLPSAVDPSEGHLPSDRAQRKRQQIENIIYHVQYLISSEKNVIVDFCAGGGHLGIALAYTYPQCQVILVENKEESLVLARQRIKSLNLTNVTCVQCNLNYFDGKFNIGVALHACGIATDLVLECCIRHKAHFVLSPCCYGSIHNTSQIHYPKSSMFQKAVNYEEYVLISGAADWTDWKFELSKGKLGKRCMYIMDTDRCMAAVERGYSAIINDMLPLECSPKNNLIIGSVLC